MRDMLGSLILAMQDANYKDEYKSLVNELDILDKIIETLDENAGLVKKKNEIMDS